MIQDGYKCINNFRVYILITGTHLGWQSRCLSVTETLLRAQDLLCGPTDVPTTMNDRIQTATQAFYDMVEDILSCKEQDEAQAEAKERGNPGVAAPNG